MLDQIELPTADRALGRRAASVQRGLEAEALLEAATTLHREGILSDLEFAAKRRLFAARL